MHYLNQSMGVSVTVGLVSNNYYVSDINECESDPCEHGGSCRDKVNGYVCDCPPGRTGDHCETGVYLSCLVYNAYIFKQWIVSYGN